MQDAGRGYQGETAITIHSVQDRKLSRLALILAQVTSLCLSDFLFLIPLEVFANTETCLELFFIKGLDGVLDIT